MIFKTYETGLDGISNKLGFNKRSFAEWGKQVSESFNNAGRGLKGLQKAFKTAFVTSKELDEIKLIKEADFSSIFPVENAKSFFESFNKSGSQSIATLTEWCERINVTDKTMKSYLVDCMQKQVPASFEGYNNYVKSAIVNNEKFTLSAKAGTVALKALRVAGNMILFAAISKGIELAVSWIDKLSHSAERCKERVDGLMSSYQSALNTANNNAKTIEGLADRYEELSKGVDNLGKRVSLTTEEYTEYNDIVNQIADMFPTLVQGYTDEGNAILSLKGNVEQLRDAYKEAQQEAYNMLISSGKDSDGNDIIKNWKNLNETSLWDKIWDLGADDVGGDISMTDAVRQLEAFSNMTAETYRNLERIKSEGTRQEIKSLSGIEKEIAYSSYLFKALKLDFYPNISDEDFEEARKQARVLAQTYNAEIQAALKNVQTLANAYLMTNDGYYSLDSDVRNAASVIVNSLNANIASQFKDKNAVGEYVDNIVQILHEDSEDSNVSKALVSLFDFDYSDMPIEDAKKRIDMYMESIVGKLGGNIGELKARLGFTDVDRIARNYTRMVQNAAREADHFGRGDYREIYSKIDAFARQYSINTQDEIAAFQSALDKANGDIDRAFEYYLNQNKETKVFTPFTTLSESQSDAIEAYKKDLSSITDIFENFRDVDITELMSTFEDYDWSDYLSGAEDLDTTLRNIANKSLQAVIDQFEGFSGCEKILDDLKQKLEETFNFDFDLSKNLAAYDELIDLLERVRNGEALQKEEVAGLINKYPDLASAISEIKDGYKLEESAIVSLINRYGEYVNTGIAANQAVKESTIKSIQAQINAYEALLASDKLTTTAEINENTRRRALGGIFKDDKDDPVSFVLDIDLTKKQIEQELPELRQKLQDILDSDEYKVDFKPTIEDASKSSSSSSSSSKQVFDWIEKVVDNASSALSKLKSKISDIYQTWTSRNKAIDKAIKQTKDNIETNNKAYAAYMDKANSIGLSAEWQKKIKDGSFSISEIDTSKEENATLVKKIQEYQEWYDKAQECAEASEELAASYQELATMKIDNTKSKFGAEIDRIEHEKDMVQGKIDLIEASGGYLTDGSYYEKLISLEKKEKKKLQKERKQIVKDMSGLKVGTEAYSKAKSDLEDIDKQLQDCDRNTAEWNKTIQDISFDMSEKRLNRLDDILDGMKDKISDTSLTWEERNKAIDDSTKQTAKNIKEYEKDIAGWMEDTDSIALSDEWKEKIMSGDYDITGIDDEELLDLIQQFEILWEQIKKNQDKVDDLNDSFKDLAKARIDNITAQFDGILADFEHRKNMIEGDIGIVQAKGHLVGASYYKELQGIERNNIATLQAERKRLIEAMNAPIDDNGNFLEKGSEGYKELEKQVNSVTKEIQNSEKALIDYDNEIRQIAWDMADFIQETISQLTNEADFYIDLMKNKDLYSDDGKLNDYGMATLGMHGLNYNTYMEQSIGYARELEELERQLADDPYNKDLIERYRERLDLQRDMVLAAEDEKQAMIDMVRDGIDAELDSLKDLIDTYKEALDAQKDLYDFQKKVDSQTQKISDIEKQILAYENDDSEEAKAKIQQLKVNLADAKEDLEDTQYDKYISDQKELLDGLYQDYENILNQRLDDVDALFESLIADVNANSDSIKETLETEAGKVGLDLSNEMETIWNKPSKGESEIYGALKVYDGDFDEYKKAFGTYADSFQKYYTEYGTKSKEQNEKLDNIETSIEDADTNEVNALDGVKSAIETGNGSFSEYATQEKERYTTLEGIFASIKTAVENINTLIHSKNFPEAVYTAIRTLDTSVTTGFSNLATAYSTAANAANTGIGNAGQDARNSMGYSSNASVFIPMSKKDTYPKNKLDKENSIVDRLRWYDFEYDFPYREYYYSALGGSGTYTGTDKQNNWLLQKMKSMGYKKGVYDLKRDETAWTQEGQPELIRTSDGAMLMPLQAGSTVFDGTATKNLFDFGNAPEDFLYKHFSSIPNFNLAPQSGGGNTINNDIELSIPLPNVTNYNELLYAFQHDKRFEKLVQDMSVNLLDGKSSMGKYRQNFR